MIHVIINEGIYNREFVEKWIFGFDRLKECIKDHVEPFTPAWAEEIKSVRAEEYVGVTTDLENRMRQHGQPERMCPDDLPRRPDCPGAWERRFASKPGNASYFTL
jgi:anaerobic selenocysteine-containing dehydrogenase